FQSLTVEKVNDKITLLHILPYVGYNAILLVSESLGLVSLSPRDGFLGLVSEYAIFYQSGQLLAIITVIYIIWGVYLIRRYKKKIGEIQSNLTSYRWLNVLLFSFIFYFAAIYAFLSFSLSLRFISPENAFFYVSFIIMAYVFALGFFGIKQSSIFTDLKIQIAPKPETKYAKSGLTDKDILQIERILQESMSTGQLFLHADISLPILAAKLNLKAPYVSQVINQRFKQNFFDFVNHFRIEEVKKRMDDPQYAHLSILGIALDCGFKSKSSFNKSFKKHTGYTPSHFKKSIK
ncbi:MAG: helix-turn-helix domain-containing protein, partial [Bacteroidota bacterium]